MPAEPFDEWIQLLESLPPGESRDKIYEAVASLLDFHREALVRLVGILRERGHAELVDELRADPLLESVFRGYGLVPEEESEPLLLPVLPSPDPMGRKWLPLVHVSEVTSEKPLKVSAFDQEILLCSAEQRIFAFSARCPAGGDLESAGLEDGFLTCSCHGVRFHLATGSAVDREGLALEKLPVRREEGLVKIAL